jgi:hypothetical protein
MKTKLFPVWLRRTSQLALALPMLGGFMEVFESDYFKVYIADTIVSVLSSLGTALIDSLIQIIFYGVA